jgi:hypothetical protein
MKKSSSSSRRKFIAGIGAAAGAVTLSPMVKGYFSMPTGERNLLNAWSHPKVCVKPNFIMKPVGMLYREAGSHLLPLSKRPF